MDVFLERRVVQTKAEAPEGRGSSRTHSRSPPPPGVMDEVDEPHEKDYETVAWLINYRHAPSEERAEMRTAFVKECCFQRGRLAN